LIDWLTVFQRKRKTGRAYGYATYTENYKLLLRFVYKCPVFNKSAKTYTTVPSMLVNSVSGRWLAQKPHIALHHT